jgi:deoxycytidine triphosphate deaminase
MANSFPGVLTAAELIKRMSAGQLIRNVRLSGGKPDVQPASYDLTAGRAVWTEPKSGETKELVYNPALVEKPYVVLQPGQMMSIITHEEILMPKDLCGTVFSKNRLALNGIFAFNAGHVDPGFEGPIVIRLINLRRSRFTVNLGERIFTIVFQTLAEGDPADRLLTRPAITMDETVRQVRQFADVALSNALFDLYADSITQRLDDHRTDIIAKLREDLSKEFVRKEKFGAFLIEWSWKKLLVLASLVGLFYGAYKILTEVVPKFHSL